MAFDDALPGGVLDAEGRRCTGIRFAPMDGEVRRELAKLETRGDPTKLTYTLLARCVAEIEGWGAVSNTLINNMMMGDINYCFMRIRRLTKGPKSEGQAICPNAGCKKTNKVPIDIDALEIHRLQEGDYRIERTPISGGQGREEAHLVFDVAGVVDDVPPPVTVSATFRYATVGDLEALGRMVETDPVGANYVMYARTLRAWRLSGMDAPLFPPYDAKMFNTVPWGVLDFLDAEFQVRQPGPEQRHEVSCYNCGHVSEVMLTGTDFFAPRQRTRKPSGRK